MKRKKVYLALILFILGMLGMLSMLTVDIPLPEEIVSVLEDKFTPTQIKLLILINPTIILIVAVVVGTILYQCADRQLYRGTYIRLAVLEKRFGKCVFCAYFRSCGNGTY